VERTFQEEGFNICQISHRVRDLVVCHIPLDLPAPNRETSNGVKGGYFKEGEGLFEGHGIIRDPVVEANTGFSIPVEL